MDCDHSACAMLIVFCSKLGDWCNLTEVRSDARCASKVNFPKITLGRQAFHHLPELSRDDDVGGGLGTVRSWVKGDAHKGSPVGDGGAACSQSVRERSLEIGLFVRGTQIQHADGRVVRSIERTSFPCPCHHPDARPVRFGDSVPSQAARSCARLPGQR